ncbi:COR domain-containing protein, partial [Candidatus Thiothrix sp. Deng01]
ISDLSPLSGLPALQLLNCGSNGINDLSTIDHLLLSDHLEQFSFYNSPKSGIPAVLLGEHEDDDCLENIKHYRQAILSHGLVTQKQLKIQLVGNGRVGKTTLAIALETGKPVDQDCDSTHGITISTLPMSLHGEAELLSVQLWDFGGQEIYHATHRLFLANDCLYLLLWAEETPEIQEETRHHVTYWLESIHDLSPDSTVIVVKNRIDLGEQQPDRPGLPPELPGVAQIEDYETISARKYWRIGILEEKIKDIVTRKLQHKVTLTLPKPWVQVQETLEKLKSEGQTTMPFPHFKQLCIKAGIDYAEWFVAYLHKTGILFYQEGAFQDQIILDQNWAIDAVYKLFDPKDKPKLKQKIQRRGGGFFGDDTSTFWPDVDESEREIYLSFMRNCGICYQANRQQSNRENLPFADRRFVIPALLPPSITIKDTWQPLEHDWLLEVDYDFLHRSIIERIIIRLGETYPDSDPWHTGIYCPTEHGQILLECAYQDKSQSTEGSLRFQLRGNQLDVLRDILRKLVSEISPHKRYREYLRKGIHAAREPLPEFEEQTAPRSRLDETKPAEKSIKLFISYSHKDEKYKKRLEEHLTAIKRKLPLIAWSDRSLFSGESVDEQIFQQLDTADIVLLLISPAFINSDYCFTKEMVRALERYRDNGSVVIPVIIRYTKGWRDHEIGSITALPKDGKPLAEWRNKDKFWGSVEDGIQAQVEKLLQA